MAECAAVTDRTAALAEAEARLAAGDAEGAFAALQSEVAGVRDDERVALLWARLLAHVADEEALTDELKRFARTWPDHLGIALALAEAAAACSARQAFDRPRSPTGLAALGVLILGRAVDALDDEAFENTALSFALHRGLARVCAEAGPPFAARAERAFVLALEADATSGPTWLERARFLLRRHDWAAARASAREAARRLSEPGPAWWMVATASLALGDGPAAVEAWRHAGIAAVPDAAGLPVCGGLEPVEVQLSTAIPGPRTPVAPRYEAEAVWVQPLSPAHGVVLHPTALDLSADVSDVVLYEGSPLGFRAVEGRRVPRFAALAVLAQGPVRTLRYAADPAPPAPAEVVIHALGPHHGKLVTRLDDAALRARLAGLDLVVPALHAGLPTGAGQRRRYAQLAQLSQPIDLTEELRESP